MIRYSNGDVFTATGADLLSPDWEEVKSRVEMYDKLVDDMLVWMGHIDAIQQRRAFSERLVKIRNMKDV